MFQSISNLIIKLIIKLIKAHTAGGRLTAIFPRQTVVFVLIPAYKENMIDDKVKQVISLSNSTHPYPGNHSVSMERFFFLLLHVRCDNSSCYFNWYLHNKNSKKAGHQTHFQGESQEVCFVPASLVEILYRILQDFLGSYRILQDPVSPHRILPRILNGTMLFRILLRIL